MCSYPSHDTASFTNDIMGIKVILYKHERYIVMHPSLACAMSNCTRSENRDEYRKRDGDGCHLGLAHHTKRREVGTGWAERGTQPRASLRGFWFPPHQPTTSLKVKLLCRICRQSFSSHPEMFLFILTIVLSPLHTPRPPLVSLSLVSPLLCPASCHT